MSEIVIREGELLVSLNAAEVEALQRHSTDLPGSLAQKLAMAAHTARVAPASIGGVKVSMEFVLPEHQGDLDDALHGTSLRLFLDEVLSEIRMSIKHGAPFFGCPVGETACSCGGTQEELLTALKTYIKEYYAERGIPWQM